MPNYTLLKVGDVDVPGRVSHIFPLGGGIVRAAGEFPSSEHIENGTPGTFPPVQLQIGQFQFIDGGFANGDRVLFDIAQGEVVIPGTPLAGSPLAPHPAYAPYATNLRRIA